jgi:DNA polymerase-4
MPVAAISGVGAVFARRLADDGYWTIGDLQRADGALLQKRYGDMGARLADLARGRDTRFVTPDRQTKSVSSETTFNTDISDKAELEAILWLLCERTAARMKAKGLAGRTATLKLKTAVFEVITRSRQLAEPSNLARSLFDAVQPLLAAETTRTAYRLIGAGFSSLEPIGAERQPLLFSDQNERLRKEEDAIDKIRQRFGDDAIALGRGHAAKLRRSKPAGAKADRDGTS